MTTKITNTPIPNKGFKYLEDILQANGLNDLPDDCIFNKKITGCGMTSAALRNKVSYVIAVPTTSLIENKLKWCKEEGRDIDMLPVYSIKKSGNDIKQIEAFKGNKIMVTYDSLHKVVDALTNINRIKDFKILVDESDVLVMDADYRAEAMSEVIEHFDKFGAFIFGSATPIDDEYQYSKLRNVDKAEIIWDNLKPVEVNHCKFEGGKVVQHVASKVVEHLKGENNIDGVVTNAHFFLNSVDDIVDILKYVKAGKNLDMDNIRIVTADKHNNNVKINLGLGDDFKYSSINSDSKRVNFYTSTCFRGCDISDLNGLTYVISNGNRDHTKIDIMVTLPQIIGRLRNSQFKNRVILMYSLNTDTKSTNASYLNFKNIEDFKKFVTEMLIGAQRIKNDFDNPLAVSLWCRWLLLAQT